MGFLKLIETIVIWIPNADDKISKMWAKAATQKKTKENVIISKRRHSNAWSAVFKNINHIEEMSGLSPWDYSSRRIVHMIENSSVPPNNEWRLSLLPKFLDERSFIRRHQQPYLLRVNWGPTLSQDCLFINKRSLV